MRFENKTFKNEDITLDCNQFTDCHFDNCRVLFAGGTFSVTRVKFTNVNFGIGGPAETTIAFMRFIRALPNGRKLLDEMLDAGPQPATTSATTLN